MNRKWRGSSLAILLPLAAISSQAQIRYLTVPTPRSPLPPMPLVQVSRPPAASTPATPPTPSPALQGPSFDKAEVEKRVLAFQRQRAQEGSASAQYALGLRYLNGQGVEKDLARARQWLKSAADGGSAEARRKLLELDSTVR